MSSLCSVRMLVKSVSLLTCLISASLLSLRNPRTSPKAWLRVPKRVVEIRRAVGQHLRDGGDVVGELHDLFVAVRQRVDQHLQIADGAEQVGARVAQSARGLRQLPQGLPE